MADSNTTGSGSNSGMDRWLMPVAFVIGCIVIALAVIFSHKGAANSGTQANGQQAAPSVNIANVKTQGEPYVGNANAPVTMALFFDYQCPFCKQFDSAVVSQIYKDYVQTGKVKIVFKDFDFLGPDSITASEYARAVWALYPDKFYTWYQAVFAAQPQENRNTDPTYLPHLEQVTKTIPGMDVSKIEANMNQNKSQYDAAVNASYTEGQGFGIQGTPSVIIGTTLMQGYEDYSKVQALLDAQLKGK